ncbi:hypothetical protein BCR43DRAFT_559235 [Syncephalastrum racemosum]|uniref:Major facilitator superfamily associated domain-containing protein n=1 Tax=Syncephalastrum racemosum TaxID=13706 RepID=A0A1X2HRP1_SYNRA|nr:hypothetical protein BCR43DRAFT_559235 [Syncephalastrum racemosum]
MDWVKILVATYAAGTTTFDVYLPLLLRQKDLQLFAVGLSLAVVWTCRLISCNLWTAMWDSSTNPRTFPRAMAALTCLATAALSALYASPTYYLLLAAILLIYSATAHPAFLDIIVIKRFGESKSWLYDRERYVGVLTAALVVSLVALDLDAVYIASGVCLLMAIVILVGIATAGGLVVQPNNDDDTYEQGLPPTFLKNAATHNTFNYKPYSLFGEPLSHISEEDSIMVGRSQYAPSLLRRDSHQSACSINSVTTTMSYYHEYGATHTSYPHRYPTNAQPTLSSAKDLAMLPMPPPHAPLATLGLPRQVGPTTLPWQLHSMSVSALLLGIIYGLINGLLPVFLVESVALDPVYCGLALMLPLVADVALHITVHWWAPRLTAMGTVGVVHGTLAVCAFSYACLRAEHSPLWVLVCQFAQGVAFQLIWLCMAQRTNILLWTEEDLRSTQVSKLSALYSALGPALGALAASFLAENQEASFAVVYRLTVALVAVSYVFAWGWSSSD